MKKLNPYGVGYALGLEYGRLVVEADTAKLARARDYAALAMIGAAMAVVVGEDAASYEARASFVRGVNAGRDDARASAAREYGHEAEAARA